MLETLPGRPGDITDDPIGPVPRASRPEDSGARWTCGCVALVAVLLTVVIGAMIAIAHGQHALAAGMVAALLVPPLLWAATNARSRLLRALRRHRPKLSFGMHADTRGSELHLHLGRFAQRPATPVDPATQADDMRRIWRCRVRDCAAFDPRSEAGKDPRRTGRIWMPLPVVVEGDFAARVDDWAAAVHFLAARPDPEAAWLASIACAEDHRWDRARAALRLLAAEPRRRELHARICRWLDDAGPFPARVAAAIEGGDVHRMDRLLDTPPAASDALVALIEARWQAAPDPAALARWVEDETLARVLARLPLPGVAPDHWLRMVAHPRVDVALTAAGTALSEGPPLALPCARALLDRADLRAQADALPADLRGVIERALDHLGHNGEVEDLRRLGGWSNAPGGLGGFAERQRTQLRGLVEAPTSAGGLALAGFEDAQGGLSETDG